MPRLRDVSFRALAVALALVACGACQHAGGPRTGGTLTIAQRDSFATFDPAFAWNPEDSPYLDLVFEGLVAFDDSGRVRPACAARSTVSDDGLTYRFDLRPRLSYADGSPIEAKDFVHGVARLFRPGALRSPGAPQFAAIAGALAQGARNAPPLGIEAPDAHTVVIHLAWPDPHLLEKLAQPRYAIPVPEKAAARLGAAYAASPVTNGPYRLVPAGRNILLFVRNPHYDPGMDDRQAARAARGYPDTVRVLSHRTARQSLLGLESGRVDLVCTPLFEYADRLGRSRTIGLVRGMTVPPIRWLLTLDAELYPLARRDVRRAVAWGVNRQRLVEQFGNFTQPSRGFADAEEAAGQAPGYDPLLARQYLEAAKNYTGVRVAVTIPRASVTATALDALTPGLARASIQVDAVPRPTSAWSTAVLARRGVMAAIVPWQAPSPDDLDGLASMLLNRGLGSGWGGNLAWYHPGSDLDSLLVQGLRDPDPVARRAVSERIGTLLESDLPFVPLARIEQVVTHRVAWTGVRIHPRTGLDLRRIHRRRVAPTS